jgi:hypothetical protein
MLDRKLVAKPVYKRKSKSVSDEVLNGMVSVVAYDGNVVLNF